MSLREDIGIGKRDRKDIGNGERAHSSSHQMAYPGGWSGGIHERGERRSAIVKARGGVSFLGFALPFGSR